jgi:ABC-type glycerol-3-phosphate transport system substrate-binding protein
MTLDEYAAIAAKLNVPNADLSKRVWGGSGPRPHWFDLRNFFSEDGHKAISFVNNAANVHAFQVIKELNASGNVLTAADISNVSPDDLLATRQLAMTVTDTVIAQPQLEAAGIKWGAAPPPVAKEGDLPWVYTGSDELGAFTGSAHLAEAKLFVIFWGTEGNAMRLAVDGLPLNIKMAVDQNWAGNSEGRKEMLAAAQTSRPNLFIPEWPSVIEPLGEAIDGLMGEDGLSAQEALDQVAPIVQEKLDAAWATWDQIQPKQ